MNRPDRFLPAHPDLRVRPSASGPSDQKNGFRAMLISAVVHASILVLLAMWVVPKISTARQVLELSAADSESLALESVAELDLAPEPVIEPSQSVAAAPDLLHSEPLEVMPLVLHSDKQPIDVSVASFSTSTTKPDSLSSSSTIEGAVDRVTGDIEAKLQKGDTLVVWLLDSSHSLVDDRRRVAERLGPFYDGLIDGRSPSGHQLRSAVVSYGAGMRQRVPPTNFGERIVSAVEDLPIDRSGNEKVFDAVAKCAVNYRQAWPDQQVMIVIWTDESGDDTTNLEQTITVCRERRVTVSVVGPSSVLGADTGLHSYTEPKSQSVYQLPVRRGPDTAMPERIELGYWFATRMGGRGGRRGGTPSWVGGQELVGILSGFSPYALTRLTMQTGGNYTIFDRAEDRAPFDPSVMERYQPSYASRDEYEQEIKSNPLRRAVMNAVAETRGKKLDEPPTMLFIKRTGERPFDFMRYYYPPDQFRAKLRSSRGRLRGQAIRSSKIVEQALRHLSEDETLQTGLDNLYKYEQSPRWRAWYDLTRGRLLATSVRLEEYRLAVDALVKPGGLASTTNHVILVSSPQKRASDKYRHRGEEAETLLRRCAAENQGTPWEILAERELEYALGVEAREMALTHQPGGPAPRAPALPRF